MPAKGDMGDSQVCPLYHQSVMGRMKAVRLLISDNANGPGKIRGFALMMGDERKLIEVRRFSGFNDLFTGGF